MNTQEFLSLLSLSNGPWKEDIAGEAFYWSFVEPTNGFEGLFIREDRKGNRVREGKFYIEVKERMVFIYIDNEKYLITFPEHAEEMVLISGNISRRLTLVRA